MVRRQFLIVISFVLGLFILNDVYQIYTLKTLSSLKTSYLLSSPLVNTNHLQALKESIQYNSQKKKSLSQYYNRIEDINLEIFKDSIAWKKYIDADDLEEFSDEINKIPHYSKDNDLARIRNRKICNAVLIYISGKVGNSGMGCWGRPSLYKDVFNNVSLFGFETGVNQVSYNGLKLPRYTDIWSVALTKSDSLRIDFEFWSDGYILSRKIESSYTIDMSLLNDR